MAASAPLTWVTVGVEGKHPTLGPRPWNGQWGQSVRDAQRVEGPAGGIAWPSCALWLAMKVVFAALFELRPSTVDMGFLRVRFTHRRPLWEKFTVLEHGCPVPCFHVSPRRLGGAAQIAAERFWFCLLLSFVNI